MADAGMLARETLVSGEVDSFTVSFVGVVFRRRMLRLWFVYCFVCIAHAWFWYGGWDAAGKGCGMLSVGLTCDALLDRWRLVREGSVGT